MQSFYASIHEEINHMPKQNMLIITGDWKAKVGNKANQMSLENLD